MGKNVTLEGRVYRFTKNEAESMLVNAAEARMRIGGEESNWPGTDTFMVERVGDDEVEVTLIAKPRKPDEVGQG